MNPLTILLKEGKSVLPLWKRGIEGDFTVKSPLSPSLSKEGNMNPLTPPFQGRGKGSAEKRQRPSPRPAPPKRLTCVLNSAIISLSF